MNYTNIRSVLTRLPLKEDQYEEADMLEWSIEALEKMNLFQSKERKFKILFVDNYKVKLPTDLEEIELVSRAIKPPRGSQIDEICDTLTDQQKIDCGCPVNVTSNVTEVNNGITTTTITTTTENPATTKVNSIVYNAYPISRFKVQPVGSNTVFDFYQSSLYTNNFKPLKALNRPMTRNLLCDKCPNFLAQCDDAFSISTDRHLVTSFEKGIICLMYIGQPVDENGEYLIPDDADVKSAIINWILYRHWEMRASMHEQNAFSMSERYLYRAERLFAKSKGNDHLRTLDFNRIKSIIGAYEMFTKNDHIWNDVRSYYPNEELDSGIYIR